MYASYLEQLNEIKLAWTVCKQIVLTITVYKKYACKVTFVGPYRRFKYNHTTISKNKYIRKYLPFIDYGTDLVGGHSSQRECELIF